jgi:hypothetical protein
VIDLDDTYRRLARPWTSTQLDARFSTAESRGTKLTKGALGEPSRPIALLATAVPPGTTASTAIHVLHALPASGHGDLPIRLVDTTEQNAADALHRCHRTLKLDGLGHGYTADDWLPVIYDIAEPLLESSRLDQEPPSLVQHAQEAVRWLSASIASLDQDSRETTAALTDTLARLLVVCVFADAARTLSEGHAE